MLTTAACYGEPWTSLVFLFLYLPVLDIIGGFCLGSCIFGGLLVSINFLFFLSFFFFGPFFFCQAARPLSSDPEERKQGRKGKEKGVKKIVVILGGWKGMERDWVGLDWIGQGRIGVVFFIYFILFYLFHEFFTILFSMDWRGVTKFMYVRSF